MPAEYFDPRDYLLEEVTARGQKIDNLIGTVQRWYHSTDPMTPRVAWAIAVYIGDSSLADGWLRLDQVWQSRPPEPTDA